MLANQKGRALNSLRVLVQFEAEHRKVFLQLYCIELLLLLLLFLLLLLLLFLQFD